MPRRLVIFRHTATAGGGTVTGAGTAAGIAAATAVAVSIFAATGTSTGTGAASGAGTGIVAATGTAAGTSTVTGVGAAAGSVGSAAGTSTASSTGASAAAGTGSAATIANGWVAFPAVTGNGIEYYSLVAGTGASAPLWWWNWDSKIYSVAINDPTAVDVPDGVTAVTTTVGSGPGGSQVYQQDWCYDATTNTVWAAVYDAGVQKLAEIDPSDGSFTLHTVTDIDRCWVDGSDRLWIRRDTDLSVIERLDKGDLTGTALETREFSANVAYLKFVGLDAYAVDQSSLTFRWYPNGGSLQTLAITSSAGYLRFITHDTTSNSLWLMTGPTTGNTHYLHEFSLASKTQVDDVTLTNRLTQSPPIFYSDKIYFAVSYTFGAYIERELVSMDISDNSFTVEANLTSVMSSLITMVQHPNNAFYLVAYDAGVSEWGIYRLGIGPGGGGLGTATGVGASTAATAGASAGTSTVSGVGAGSGAVGSSDGTSTVTGIGASTAASAGSAAGTGAATGVSESTGVAAGSSAGTGTATGVGASTATSAGSAAGTSTATAVGAGSGAGVGTGAGTGTATGVGASTAESTGTAAGTSDATAVNADGGTVGTAAGTSTVTGVGDVLRATGAGTASGVGTAAAGSTQTGSGAGTSEGTGTVTGVSPQGAGTSEGTGTATGVGAPIAAATGTAAGVGTATATGLELGPGEVTGNAYGTSTAEAYSPAVYNCVPCLEPTIFTTIECVDEIEVVQECVWNVVGVARGTSSATGAGATV